MFCDKAISARIATHFAKLTHNALPEATREAIKKKTPAQLRVYGAQASNPTRLSHIRQLACPTLVIHGVDDPLVPVACGEDLAQRIANATADFIPGMGHDLPEELLGEIQDAFLDGEGELPSASEISEQLGGRVELGVLHCVRAALQAEFEA